MLAALECGKDARPGTIRKIAATLGVSTGFYMDAVEVRAAQLKIGGITRKRAGLSRKAS